MRCAGNQQCDSGRCSTCEDAAEVRFLVARGWSGCGRGRRVRVQRLSRTDPGTVPHGVHRVTIRGCSRPLNERGSPAHDGPRPCRRV